MGQHSRILESMELCEKWKPKKSRRGGGGKATHKDDARKRKVARWALDENRPLSISPGDYFKMAHSAIQQRRGAGGATPGEA